MKTSTLGLLGMLGSLLVACEGSVEPVGGSGAGGENEGGSEIGGDAPLGGGGAVGGAGEGGAGEGGAVVGGAPVGGSGEGGAPSEECALMEQVAISGPELVDAGGDLVWSPGETATFSVTLTNEAAVDNFNYPGAVVTSAEPGITGGNNTLFGIFAGEATELTVTATAAPAVASGTEVELVFDVTTLSKGCGELASVGLTVTIE